MATWASPAWPLASSKASREREFVSETDMTVICDVITGVTTHHLRPVQLSEASHRFYPLSWGRDDTKVPESTGRDSRRPAESVTQE